jgi:methylenetetrahydrofolate--tRNA-(uracil-5-)-methyltransferase
MPGHFSLVMVELIDMELNVIGGGLAGSEAAWQAAQRGLSVKLFEMRPTTQTGAHLTDSLAEIVCSNSFGSTDPDRAQGLLKTELEMMGSLLLDCARACAVPAGGALAVDRSLFSSLVTQRITSHPRIELIRQEVTEIPTTPTIVASGPLTSPKLAASLHNLTGSDHLFFFDAIAPIVQASSIDMSIAFRASRYGRGEQADGDYINCPLDEEQYLGLVDALKDAERIPLKHFEAEINVGVRAGHRAYFEGCLPVEVIARRGPQALAYGPMRPVGLRKVHTAGRIAAVVQLRQDNIAASLYNMVGFQTNLTYTEQKRVFRMIPGLEQAEFVRFGQMHRNTFIASPLLLEPSLKFKGRNHLFFGGQITGVEGYMGNIATGLLAGINASRALSGDELLVLPPASMLGALCHYITHADLKDFQPMKANFGILPALDAAPRVRKDRSALYVKRGLADLTNYLAKINFRCTELTP